ncbi:MAG: hypothetical protein WDM84_03145 [Bauldia sp.]
MRRPPTVYQFGAAGAFDGRRGHGVVDSDWCRKYSASSSRRARVGASSPAIQASRAG